MPFNGSNVFESLGLPNFPAVSGDLITSAAHNNNLQDIFDGLTSVRAISSTLGSLTIGSPTTTETRTISVGGGRTGSGISQLLLVGDTTYSTSGLGITRNAGANGGSSITNRGTGALAIANTEAADITFATTAIVRLTVGTAGITSTLPISGTNFVSSGIVSLAAGTVGAPSLPFTGDLNSGIWSPGADTVAISTAGAERLRVDSAGDVGIGTTTTNYRGFTTSTIAVGGTNAGELQLARTIASAGSSLGALVWIKTDAPTSVAGERGLGTISTLLNSTATTSGGILSFSTKTEGATVGATERMRIDSAGFVGIGITTPTALGSGGTPVVLQTHSTGTGTASFGMHVLSSAATGNTSLMGALTFGSTGLSGAEKRTAQIISQKTDALTVNPVGDLKFQTSSGGGPANRLIIASNGDTTPGADGTQLLGDGGSQWSAVYAHTFARNDAGVLTINAVNAAGTIALRTAGATRLTIAASDLVTVGGVAAPAWSTTNADILQLGTTGVQVNSTNDYYIYNNSYYDGANDRYNATDFAARYAMIAGAHQWDTAASGTAGNVVTLTTRLSLSNTGVITHTPSVTGTNFSSSAALSGGINSLAVANTSNTASSDCSVTISTGGSSGGDPYLVFNISGVVAGHIGLDNSNSDEMSFSANNNVVGSGNRIALTTDGRFYGTALHNNAGAITGTTNQYVASGTYTPTLTNSANVAASTMAVCQWIRVGNVVTVSGAIEIDPTAGATATSFTLTLPIASSFVANTNCGGSAGGVPGTGVEAYAIYADVVGDRAFFTGFANSAANHTVGFTFTYITL